MKLFVAVVLFVMGPFVFAADPVWEASRPPSVAPRSSLQGGGPEASQQGHRKVYPHEHPAEWWERTATVIAMVLAVILIGLILYQMQQEQRATASAEQSAKDSAQASWATGRAHVAVEQWKIEDLWEDEAAREITFSIVNRGRVPATIIATAGGYQLEKTLPPPFDPLQEQLDPRLAGAKLSANTPLGMCTAVPSGTAFRKEIESQRRTLYAFVYVEYEDGRGQHQKVSVFVEYSIFSGHKFIPVGGRCYNYRT